MSKEPNFRFDLYILYIAFMAFIVIAPLMPLTLFIAIGASLRRKKATGILYDSHFLWIIYTFIIFALAFLFMSFFHSMPAYFPAVQLVAVLALIWIIYRLGKGLWSLRKDRPIANPKALF